MLDFDVTKDATHHWYSTLFVLIATGVLLGGRSVRRVLAAGILCGLAAIFTQSQGLLSLIAIAGYLWWTGEDNTRRRAIQLADPCFHLSLSLAVFSATLFVELASRLCIMRWSHLCFSTFLE